MSPSTCRIRTTKKRTREDNLDVDAVECPIQKRVRSTGSCTVVDWLQSSINSSSTAVEESLGKEHLVRSERKQVNFTPPASPLNETPAPPVTKLTSDALHKFSQIMDMPPPHPPPESTVNTEEEFAESSDYRPGIGPYDPNYEIHLRERGVEFANYNEVPPPSNFAELKAALLVPWTGPEPDDDAVMDFRRSIEAGNEAGILSTVLPRMIPNLQDLKTGKTEKLVTDAFWNRKLLLKPDIQPILTPAKPDGTIGWHAFTFNQYNSLKRLALHANPATSEPKLMFPVFSIEGKGEKGTVQIACLQNLHSSAIALNNLLQLRQLAGKRSEFFGKAHIMCAEVTTDILQLSCYWATDVAGEVKYYGKCVKAWCLRDPEGEGFKEALKGLNNAIRWTLKQALSWIVADLDTLEKKLVAERQKQLALNLQTSASRGTGGSRGKGRGRSRTSRGGRGESVSGQKRTASTSSLSQPESSRGRSS